MSFRSLLWLWLICVFFGVVVAFVFAFVLVL